VTLEFTGERLIPGKVDVDLWNEHIARYIFAGQLASGRRVLDAGCGAGYGSAEFAAAGAESIVSLDISADALRLIPDADVVQASAACLPFAGGSFDLIAAFEVIEHIPDWPSLLAEAARVLTPGGVLVVSTPSIEFYAETRRESGPNPYHVHEFDYAEFEAAVRAQFAHCTIYTQDHTEGVAFHRVADTGGFTDLYLQRTPSDPDTSNFFVAVCSREPLPQVKGLIYIPNAANALREKLRHIARLEGEIRTKDEWLSDQQRAHRELLRQHEAQAAELAARHEWALSLESRLKDAGTRIVELQDEFAAQQQRAREIIDQYDAALKQADAALEERTMWAQQMEADLTAQLTARTADLQGRTDELVRCVEFLHKTEADLDERTRWALELDGTRERLEAEIAAARAQLDAVQASRWVKLGRAVGIGPELARR